MVYRAPSWAPSGSDRRNSILTASYTSWVRLYWIIMLWIYWGRGSSNFMLGYRGFGLFDLLRNYDLQSNTGYTKDVRIAIMPRPLEVPSIAFYQVFKREWFGRYFVVKVLFVYWNWIIKSLTWTDTTVTLNTRHRERLMHFSHRIMWFLHHGAQDQQKRNNFIFRGLQVCAEVQ